MTAIGPLVESQKSQRGEVPKNWGDPMLVS